MQTQGMIEVLTGIYLYSSMITLFSWYPMFLSDLYLHEALDSPPSSSVFVHPECRFRFSAFSSSSWDSWRIQFFSAVHMCTVKVYASFPSLGCVNNLEQQMIGTRSIFNLWYDSPSLKATWDLQSLLLSLLSNLLGLRGSHILRLNVSACTYALAYLFQVGPAVANPLIPISNLFLSNMLLDLPASILPFILNYRGLVQLRSRCCLKASCYLTV